MNENKSKQIQVLGVTTTAISLLIRFNARAIAWPRTASWGTQVEATPFYAKQQAIEDISNLFLAFGLILLAAVLIHSLWKQQEAEPPLSPFE